MPPVSGPASVISPLLPRLLVSVRTVQEASAALEGGCDVLDVKEPLRGPLGMADLDVIDRIARETRMVSPGTPLSIALGEVADWSGMRPFPALPDGIAFVKGGVAGLGLAELECTLRRLCDASRAQAIDVPPRWVLAAYADSRAAGAPELEPLFDLAGALGFWGILIDTWNKQGPALPQLVSESRLHALADRARGLDLQLALAGRLKATDIPWLGRIGPDIVGIRSAACAAGDRSGSIRADQVAAFGEALRATATIPGRTPFDARSAAGS